MYSELRIVTTNDLEKRSYVCFYLNGKRIREYNGKNLGLKIQPNFASSIEERHKLLKKLEFELLKALESGQYPVNTVEPKLKEVKAQSICKTTSVVLEGALEKKLSSNISKFYKRNLRYIHKHFIDFLSPEELNSDIDSLKVSRIEEFLKGFCTSGTYYMNKRRDLGVLFATASKQIEQKLSVVKETETKRSKAKLHRIYESDQIKPVLQFLKKHHPNLYICCLLSYGCFLRPHQEVRKLCGHHFKKDCTEIHLSGTENKGGKVRVVFIPDYVRDELIQLVENLQPEENLFTRLPTSYNDAYFNTAWTRMWERMHKVGIIQKDQTIYSFRHTAAVNVYRKTKDIYILQQLLGHSDMIVTLKYLRGLGEHNMDQLKIAMPDL